MHTNFSAISSERDIFDGTRACLQYVRNTPPPSEHVDRLGRTEVLFAFNQLTIKPL